MTTMALAVQYVQYLKLHRLGTRVPDTVTDCWIWEWNGQSTNYSC